MANNAAVHCAAWRADAANRLFTMSEIAIDFTDSVIMLGPSRSEVEGAFRRRSQGGERERHLRAGIDAILTHGRPRDKPARDKELLARPDR